MNMTDTIELPFGFFDAHVHFRTGQMLKLVVPHTAKYAYGAIVMPNTKPEIVTTEDAKQYREEIMASTNGADFTPYMTCYLTDETDLDDLERGFEEKLFVGGKLYPPLGTTGAERASSVRNMTHVFKRMDKIGMPLLIHGEIANEELDPLDMEAAFLNHTLIPHILEEYSMPIVLEHITTADAAELVRSEKWKNLFATITAHHLLYSHRHIFQKGKIADRSFKRGLRPNFFCLPLLKTDEHTEALRGLVASGCPKAGAGTDSAPHDHTKKYEDCGCAGCFTAPVALQMYTTAFEKAGALEKLSPFLGMNIPHGVYGIFPKKSALKMVRKDMEIPVSVTNGYQMCVEILDGGAILPWDIESAK